MNVLDRIPPLPQTVITSTEVLICPWCKRSTVGKHPLDENGYELIDFFECHDCGKVFELTISPESDDLIAVGVRSDTDRRYMEAAGVDEADVHNHHCPTVVAVRRCLSALRRRPSIEEREKGDV